MIVLGISFPTLPIPIIPNAAFFGATQFYPCAFCSEPATTHHEKQGWHVCNRGSCNEAAEAQKERLMMGLVDCEETRNDALRWVKARLP